MCGFADDISQPYGANVAARMPFSSSSQAPIPTVSRASFETAAGVISSSIKGLKEADSSKPVTPSHMPLPPEAAATLQQLKLAMHQQPPTPQRPATPSVPAHIFAILQWHGLSSSAAVRAQRVQSLDIGLGSGSVLRRVSPNTSTAGLLLSHSVQWHACRCCGVKQCILRRRIQVLCNAYPPGNLHCSFALRAWRPWLVNRCPCSHASDLASGATCSLVSARLMDDPELVHAGEGSGQVLTA